jgi:hypothetical protein
LLLGLGIVLVVPLRSGPNERAGKTPAPPLGLWRLASAPIEGRPTLLAPSTYDIDDLSAVGGQGNKRQKDTVDFIDIAAGKEWSRSLRGSPNDVVFVSFQIYASQTTIVEVGGARLGLAPGPMAGSLQLMFDDSAGSTINWQALRQHFSTDQYEGKTFAALPTLTVRLDPATSTWDLYVGNRMASAGLPLLALKKGQRQFVFRAGNEGAWIGGLIISDENPLYEDANSNGIDDRFEQEKRGGLLPAAASAAERRLLAEQWKENQRAEPPPPLFMARIIPEKHPL